jgi:excisionase family DNA binding protein
MPASPFTVTHPHDYTGPTLAIKKQAVAIALDVSVRHVENLIARGELRAIKLGKCCRVRPADLAEYLERMAASSSETKPSTNDASGDKIGGGA